MRHPRIDVLLNNAGVVNLSYTTTPDGIETTFAVNHLAYFMLTLLVRDALAAAPKARIVNVASDAHRWGRIDFDDLGNARRYRAMRVYGQSKLCNILFTYELGQRLAGSPITAVYLHPGEVATRLERNNGRIATVTASCSRRGPASHARGRRGHRRVPRDVARVESTTVGALAAPAGRRANPLRQGGQRLGRERSAHRVAGERHPRWTGGVRRRQIASARIVSPARHARRPHLTTIQPADRPRSAQRR
jgi:NAD(P)-dependent dehydrogenase (short-subunit alcohol dehydrogenase family)